MGKSSESGPGLLRRLTVLVVVLGAVAALLEVGGRVGASVAAERALTSTGGAERADVTVGAALWRPTLLPAVAGRPLDRVSAELEGVDVGPLSVDRVTYRLEDVRLELSADRRPVRIAGVGSGAVLMELSAGSLAAVLGTPVAVEGSTVLLGAERAPAEVAVDGGMLVVRTAGRTFDPLPVDDPDLLPCPPAVSVGDDVVRLACTGTRVPGILNRSLDPPATGGRPSTGANVGPSPTVTQPGG